jgi:hypothetical protein
MKPQTRQPRTTAPATTAKMILKVRPSSERACKDFGAMSIYVFFSKRSDRWEDRSILHGDDGQNGTKGLKSEMMVIDVGCGGLVEA